MAFLPDYDHDIFLSYAGVDDVPLGKTREGWVSAFFHELKALLAMQLGRADALAMWMDRQLIGNEPFSDALLQRVNRSAALIIILSSGYLSSEWCRKETNWFLQAIEKKPHANQRVFIVEIQPIDRQLWPEEFKNILGYKFWKPGKDHKALTLGYPVPRVSNDIELYSSEDSRST